MKSKLFRIAFLNHGKLYELYAGSVEPGALPGFVTIGDLRFGEQARVVIDPSEEKLRTEFDGVEQVHVPFHAVIRIDEVTHRGVSKIHDADGASSVTPFPGPFTTTGSKKD
jgi:hypothetical protein